MTDKVNFSEITPCGGNCGGCKHFISGDCIGCLKNGGECISMWQNGCDIFRCCKKHNAKFCGLCGEFPWDWLINKMSEWDKNAIEHLKELAESYKNIWS